VLAHERGKIALEQVWPKPVGVKVIRKRVKMSQTEFSRAYGIGKRALQEWEQGGRPRGQQLVIELNQTRRRLRPHGVRGRRRFE